MTEPSNASQQLQSLIAEIWEFKLKEDPLFATQVGDHRYNNLVPKISEYELTKRLDTVREYVKKLSAIAKDSLTSSELISYDILSRNLNDEIRELSFRFYLMPISRIEGIHISFSDLPKYMPFDTIQDYNNYIARLDGFYHLIHDHISLMHVGMTDGFMPPKCIIEGIDVELQAHIVSSPEQSEYFKPFDTIPPSIGPEDKNIIRAEGKKVIMQSIVPGYESLLRFIQHEYLPLCRDTFGVSELLKGREFYNHRIRTITSLQLSPNKIHETGLKEVKRIKEEMIQIIDQLGFEGSFNEFVEKLRTEERFYPKTENELLKEVAYILKRMEGELPKLFKKLPRMTYGLKPIPALNAPYAAAAYYFPPVGDGKHSGTFYLNTSDLQSRPLYEIEALSFHEAVPGHHLQIALQQECENLPSFRRFEGTIAFYEGWALYAERLGLEVGFYEDPYSNFGRLGNEIFRSCRLVVDTGLHAFGWSRQQAIDFMVENSCTSIPDIIHEIDRYISTPGQALAYKIGELKIRELRSIAEQKLGTRFDLREFHDTVLSNGAVPLDVLEKIVNDWILHVQKKPNSPIP